MSAPLTLSVAGIDVPERVRALAGGRPCTPVWRNALGGVTFAVDGPGAERSFVKWAAAGSTPHDEAPRLRWAGRWIVVPRVIDAGRDDRGSWLVTAGLTGDNAVTPQWLAQPRTAVTAIGRGLRAMHDAMPVDACPFSWSVDARCAAVPDELVPGAWHDDHRALGAEGARAALADAPPVDTLVVCHGDACAPNTLIDAGGSCSGHVDLGRLGVADRWADLAVATWSATWNYGPEWENVLLAAYGVDRDEERMAYYRLLWDVSPA